MQRILLTCLVLLSLIMMSACSTILNSTTEEIAIKTTPPNAKITIDGKKFGTTPQVVNIERGKDHIVKFDLDGFEPYEIQLTRKISKYFWLNIFNGIIPGMVIDMFSGSMYYLLPEAVEAELSVAKVEEKKKK